MGFNFNKDNWSVGKIVTIAVTAGFVAIGGVTFAVNQHQADKLNASIAQNNKTLEEKNNIYADLTAEGNNKTEVEEIHVKLNSAATAGQEVASLQNNYVLCIEADKTDDYIANKEAMRKYVDEDSSDVWYGLLKKYGEYEWTFNSTYSFSETSVPVLWTCKSPRDNILLAYAVGTYVVESDKFTHIECRYTSQGKTLMDKAINEFDAAAAAVDDDRLVVIPSQSREESTEAFDTETEVNTESTEPDAQETSETVVVTEEGA